jgi:hypothetical protein
MTAAVLGGLLTAIGLALPGTAAAQGVRGQATTTVRYLTLRPIQLDTVARADVDFSDGQATFQGEAVYCPASGDACTRYLPADMIHGVVATEDISATAWGLGVQGLSATVLLRGRSSLADDLSWPQSDDAFDAILAYAQYQRAFYRVRAGRQQTLSGLGFTGYDGLDVRVAPLPWLRAEAYGGRSLARGLYEPRHEALRPIEPFVPDQNAWLVGAFLEVEPRTGTAISGRYQREIWADRVGLISERAALDVRSDLPGPLRMDASLDYDLGFGRVGKAHLTLRSRLPEGWGWLEATGRRYVPYFDMSTIWGFFSPTPYHEGELKGTLLKLRPLTVWASAGWRTYGDPEIDVLGPPIGDASQRYALGASWRDGRWLATGEYRLETGFGAFLSSGDVRVRWTASQALRLDVRAAAFQQIEQFRVGENTVLGGGAGAELRLPFDLTLRAGADYYAQAYENRAGEPDWNQLRAYTVLTVPFGEDPGMRGQR